MPRKGENIRKRKDGRWEARYEKSRDQNGRIQYGYVYAHTYDSVKKKKLAILCKNRPQTNIGRKIDRKSTRLNSSHWKQSRMPSSA